MRVTFPDGKKRVEITKTQRDKCNDVRLLFTALQEVGVTGADAVVKGIQDALVQVVTIEKEKK